MLQAHGKSWQTREALGLEALSILTVKDYTELPNKSNRKVGGKRGEEVCRGNYRKTEETFRMS